MGIEIRVHCEYPRCEETAIALAHDDENFDASGIVDRLELHADPRSFHFVVDTGWINGPEGWTLGEAEEEMLCPNHRGSPRPTGG